VKATPVNVLAGGGFMRKCRPCGRLKATFASDPKGHRGIGDVCWTCWTAAAPRKAAKRQEPVPRAPGRPGRPNTGSLWQRSPGGIWYAVITRDGKTRRVSSGSRNRAVAERFRARLLAEQKFATAGVDRNRTETPDPSQNLPTLNPKDERSRA